MVYEKKIKNLNSVLIFVLRNAILPIYMLYMYIIYLFT